MNSNLTYLASPYSHPDPSIRLARFDKACKMAAFLMLRGEIIFCPIAHSHPMDQYIQPWSNWEFWKKQDFAILEHCTKLKVLTLDGWEYSEGVQAEITKACELDIPVEFIKDDKD